MVKRICVFILGISFCTAVFSQNSTTAYEQLCKLNKEWLNKEVENFPIHEKINPLGEIELIQLHLILVEKYLRDIPKNHLTKNERNNRLLGLDILNRYSKRALFPVNCNSPYRIPIFIDDNNTACAVGYLIQETGYNEVAEKISNENNYTYVEELGIKYDALGLWAREYGFSQDELSWIQPIYGNACQFDTVANVTDASCPGICDGEIVLQYPPISGPFTFFPTTCDFLCPGNYTYIFTDSLGNIYTQNYTVNNGPPIGTVAQMVTNVSALGNCDGILTYTASSPITIGSIQWIECQDSIVLGSNDTISGLCAGSYVVVVTDTTGICVDTSNCITLGLPLTSSEVSIESLFRIFPNPALSVINWETNLIIKEIEIIDITGKLLMTVSSKTTLIKIGALRKGIYFLKVKTDDQIIIRKFIKN